MRRAANAVSLPMPLPNSSTAFKSDKLTPLIVLGGSNSGPMFTES